MTYMSIFLIVIGFLFRTVSYYKLKENFSWRVKQPNLLIKDGIYKYVRHPMYLGGLLAYTGLILLSSKNIFLTAVMFSLILSFILDRVDREDNILFYRFGLAWEEYARKTKALIPFVI